MQSEWVKICQFLEKSLNTIDYKVCIAPLKASLLEGTLRVVAKDAFIANMVRKRFLSEILKAAEEALGFLPCVEVLAQSDQEGLDPDQPKKRPAPLPAPLPAQRQGVAPGHYQDVTATAQFAAPASASSAQGAQGAQGGQSAASFLSLPVQWPSAPRHTPRWRYSFENFVVGPCNELAHAASRSLCASGMNFTELLYLCSPPGLGKTHLMHSVGRNLSEECNLACPKVAYLSAEEFSSGVRNAIKNNEMDKFKGYYRNLDILLLENIHFLQKKEGMQAELLGTINALLERGGRVVCSSAFAPRDLHDMDAQLLSLMHSGLIAGIDKPDGETCRRIVRQKAAQSNTALSDEVANFLADHVNTDIRQIEGCLQKLILKAQMLKCNINLQMVGEVVREYTGRNDILDMESIIRHICSGFGLSLDELCSKSHKKTYVNARNAAFYLAHKHTRLTLEKIGERFNRTHSTVIKGITSLEQEMERGTPLGRQLNKTISLIEQSANYI